MADAAGGTVSIVDAAMLGDQMKNLLTESFVATQVEATLIAPRTLFWFEDIEVTGAHLDLQPAASSASTGASGEAAEEKKSRLQKLIGNVRRNTTVTFKFGIRLGVQVDENARIPFQVSSSFNCITDRQRP